MADEATFDYEPPEIVDLGEVEEQTLDTDGASADGLPQGSAGVF